jgi:hypothetical protein
MPPLWLLGPRGSKEDPMRRMLGPIEVPLRRKQVLEADGKALNNCYPDKCGNFIEFCLGAMDNIFIFAAHLR